MGSPAVTAAKKEPLYGSEAEVASMVLGPGRLREWREKAVVLEREGLPKIDPLMGGRYLPAVRAFLDQRHGLVPRLPSGRLVPSGERGLALKVDGPETWPKQLPKKESKPSTLPGSSGATAPAGNVSPIGPPRGK